MELSFFFFCNPLTVNYWEILVKGLVPICFSLHSPVTMQSNFHSDEQTTRCTRISVWGEEITWCLKSSFTINDRFSHILHKHIFFPFEMDIWSKMVSVSKMWNLFFHWYPTNISYTKLCVYRTWIAFTVWLSVLRLSALSLLSSSSCHLSQKSFVPLSGGVRILNHSSCV